MIDKIYTLSGSKTLNFVAEFTHQEMIDAGYDCPKEYAHDFDMWENADVRMGDPSIEVYDVDVEEVE